MTHKYYVVEGSGSFPIDMLRYDQSFTASEYDSGLIERNTRRKISLRSNADHAASPASIQRWSSFGWSVKPF